MYIHTSIYIYIYVCVCVRVLYAPNSAWLLDLKVVLIYCASKTRRSHIILKDFLSEDDLAINGR